MNRRYLLTGLKAAAAACLMAPATAMAAGPARKKGGGSAYTQLPMITVYTQSRRQKHGTLTIEMGLEAREEALRGRISLSVPRLRDAFVRRLQTYAMGLDSTSLVDVDYLTRELQAATDEVLQQKGAKVLLSTVLLN